MNEFYEQNDFDDDPSSIFDLFGPQKSPEPELEPTDDDLSNDVIDAVWRAKRQEVLKESFYNPRDVAPRSVFPTMLKDSENISILAQGMLYWVYGEPGTRKTWLALKLLSEVRTLYIDLESEPWHMGSRLSQMQIEREKSDYFWTPTSPTELLRLIEDVVELPVEAVVIDAASGLFRLFGLDPNNDQDVAQVFGDILKPLRSSGKAVIIVDHIAKSAGNKDFPFGSQNKKAQSDVCMFLKLEDHTNDTVITVTKDRHFSLGNLVPNIPGDLGVMKLEGDPIEVNIYPIGSFELEVVQLRTKEQEAQDILFEYIRKNPGILFGAMEGIKGLAGSRKTRARDKLIELGLIEVREAPRKNSGVNNKHLYVKEKQEIAND